MWARIINAILGVWLMAAPAVLGYGEPARTSDRIAGPIAAAVAVIAIWEVTRPLRWVNLVIGLWLLAAPWVLAYYDIFAAALNSSAVGLLLILFATSRGKIKERYGGGWSSLWKSDAFSQEQGERRGVD